MSQRMIKQFMEMVQIDSESGNEARVHRLSPEGIQEIGGRRQKGRLRQPGGQVAGHKTATARSRSCSPATPTRSSPGSGIKPKLENGVIRSAGDTILGADDKAGIAEMLEALRMAKVRPPIEVAISRQEEVGLHGRQEPRLQLAAAPNAASCWTTTRSTPSSSAGLPISPSTSRSRGARPTPAWSRRRASTPSLAAARAIAALRLGRLDHETTANVGVIQGGIIRNGVPDCGLLPGRVPQPDSTRRPRPWPTKWSASSAAKWRRPAPRSTSRSTTSARRCRSPRMPGP